MLHDDSVGEHLNETGQFGDGLIVRGTHFLVVDNIENSTRLHRDLGERMLLPATLMFHKSDDTTPNEYIQAYSTDVSKAILLCNIFLFLLLFSTEACNLSCPGMFIY